MKTRILAATIFLLIVNLHPLLAQSPAGSVITARYFVLHNNRDVYVMEVSIDTETGEVVQVKLSPNNNMLLDMILAPTPQHLFIGREGVRTLLTKGIITTSYGRLELVAREGEPAPQENWLIIDVAKARLIFDTATARGVKMVYYDTTTGIMVYEGFRIGGVNVRVDLAEVSERIYIKNPASPTVLAVLYGLSALFTAGALYTLANRRRYAVV